MDFNEVLTELQSIGKARIKKTCFANGVREPSFGVATGAMKHMAKIMDIAQAVSDKWIDSGEELKTSDPVRKEADKGRIGFKRKYVRCQEIRTLPQLPPTPSAA